MGKYQAYPEYKDSGIDWIGDIPEHWIVAELKRYAWVQGGYAFSSDSFVDSGIPVIRIGDIKQDGTISLESCKYIKDAVSIQYRNFEVHSGDLLMAMTGATIGKAGWFKGSQRALLNQRVGSFKCNKSFLNYKFFWYVLNSLGYQEHIRITAFGGAQPNISDTGMVSYQSAIPDLIEQEKIANFLDHETAKIDILIDKQQQLIQLLKEKRQAVISHAVTKGLNPNAPMRDSGVEWLGEIPIEWRLMNLGWFSDIRRGSGYQNINMNIDQAAETISMFRISDIHTIDPVKIVKTNEVMRYTIAENDILVAGTGATAGISTIIKKEDHGLVHSYNSIKVSIENKKISNQFIQYYLCSNFILGLLDVSFSGSAQHFVDINGLSKLKILIPSINEQLKIVSYLNKKVSDFESLEKKAIDFITLLQERRTALISAAVTGKIDVRHHVSRPTGNDTSEVSA